METVKVELEVSKELKEVGDFIVALINGIKGDKDVPVLLGELVGPLMVAVQGFDKLGEESKSKYIAATSAYIISGLAVALLAKKEE